jgi:hypothetical protein
MDIINSTNGCILNDHKNENYIFKSDNFRLINNNLTYTFSKEKTTTKLPFIWFGYKMLPTKVKNIIKFDIMFLSDVPSKYDNFFIKTHNPEEYYNDWLSQCIKDEFVHIELPIYLGKSEQLVIFIMDECLKSVNFVIKNIEIVPDSTNYKFISFYTEGTPHDKCFNLSEAVSIYKSNISNYVDSIRFYSARELRSNKETEWVVKEFSFEPKCNQFTNFIGYLAWKPYIILKTLLESNEGDIIYYRDSNCKKYPEILHHVKNTVLTLNFVLNDNDIFMPIENYPRLKNKKNIKKEVFEHFELYNNEMLESYLLNASIIVCRKNEKNINFMNDWLNACKNEKLITAETFSKQHPAFEWNTQEQAIMNILHKKYVKMNLGNEMIYSFNNRKFGLRMLTRKNRVAILLAGNIRNNNIELIKNNKKYLFELYNCDIFISTWDKPVMDNLNIQELYNNIKSHNIENDDDWFSKLPETYKYFKNRDKLEPVFREFYKIWDCNKLKKEYENANNFNYDLVFCFTPDMFLVQEIPQCYLKDFFNINKDLSKNKIFALNPPTRSFYGNNESMNQLCDCWLNIVDYINLNDEIDTNANAYKLLLQRQCLLNNLDVKNIPVCIGDIYRD